VIPIAIFKNADSEDLETAMPLCNPLPTTLVSIDDRIIVIGDAINNGFKGEN
jgi:hypothetical protein